MGIENRSPGVFLNRGIASKAGGSDRCGKKGKTLSEIDVSSVEGEKKEGAGGTCL